MMLKKNEKIYKITFINSQDFRKNKNKIVLQVVIKYIFMKLGTKIRDA